MSNVHSPTIGLDDNQREELSAPDSDGGSFFIEEPTLDPILKDPDIVSIPLDETEFSTALEYQHKKLALLFDSDVRRIYEELDLSRVNKHEESHMRRVANGVRGMCRDILGQYHPPRDVDATTQGTGVHDIGYKTHGKDPRTLTKRGGAYADHPSIGAEMFREAMQPSGDIRPDWWTEDHDKIAYDSIFYHSNGSDYVQYWERLGRPYSWRDILPMYARFIDKIDNTYQRVYPSHMEELGNVLGIPPAVIRTQMEANHNILKTLPSESVKRYKSTKTRERFLQQHASKESIDTTLDRLYEFDPGYVHRIVPYAITNQELVFSPKERQFGIIYDVDVDRVGCVLGIPYTPDHHFRDFIEAYGYSSMPRAADVTRRIKSLMEEQEVDEQEPTFTVFFNYSNGESRRAKFCAHVE